MKTPKLILCVVICVLVVLVWPQIVSAQSPDDQKHDTQGMKEHLDQLSTRARLISDEINRRATGDHGKSISQDGRVGHMSESLVAMARELKVMIDASQRLLQSEVVTGDQQLGQDVAGLRAQLKYITKSMENIMQYLEHMTYKLGRVSSGTATPETGSHLRHGEKTVLVRGASRPGR